MAFESPPEGLADVAMVPSTPPRRTVSTEGRNRTPSRNGQHTNIQHNPSTTPPASAQFLAAPPHEEGIMASLLSTPTTSRKNASRDLPSTNHIDNAGEDELRSMVKSLVNDLTDARITAANTRLQHHFLSLETTQAAERAEVEHQLSRRQVDFLRGKQNRTGTKGAFSNSSAVQPPSVNEVLTQTIRDLESQCEALEDICDQLKREKEAQAERIQSLSEHNTLLVNRIRENREHFTRIRERSPNFVTPREAFTTPRRRGYSRYQDDTPAHGPFAALIAADQILSQETASVPSTPTRNYAARSKHGHTRGAHSLSAINTPKNHDRPNTSDGFLGSQLVLSAPGSQLVNESAERERHDRDSTISVSDHENVGMPGELTQSQASSLATDMLRRNPGAFESMRSSQDAEKSSNLLQSKLLGAVKKPGAASSTSLKRVYGFKEGTSTSKKMRPDEMVGLGIGA